MDLLKELNDQQRAAVEQIEGPCMIVAGAGSGKTRVLTFKIAHLIESGINPFEILALTFTNKAANEMKERIFKLIGSAAANIWMGTFHSVFARILRIDAKYIGFDRNFSIYDEEDCVRLISDILKERGLSTENTKPQAVNGFIKGLKSSLVLPEEYKSANKNYFEKIIETVYPIYQERLFRNNSMDFDDLLLNPIRLFESNPDVLKKYQNRFRFILVDEYQDTNKAQYRIVKLLSEGHGNISIVGDDAQSIYRWRGAEIENIFKFESDFDSCNTFKLEKNYRSTKNILSVADDVIKQNKRQIPKTLFTENEDGEPVTVMEVLTDREEASMVVKWIMEEIHRLKLNFKDFVVLYRTNAQSRTIEDALRTNAIPYVIVGGVKFYQRKEIKDVLAYLKILVNRKDNESMTRILRLREGIGDVTIDKLKLSAQNSGLSMSDSLIEQYLSKKKDSKLTKIEAELKRLAELIEKYRQVMNELDPGELARSIVDEIGIIREYRNQGTEEAMDRMYNIQELLSGISEYTDETENPTLEGFLQEVSLVTDIDNYDDKKNAVTLMTSHAAKGLEYPVVFITGLEEGIFPLSSSTMSQEELEEERRLFYVSITRAMKKLYMTYSLTRYRFGMPSYQMRSRFIKDLNMTNIKFIQSGQKKGKKVVQEEGSSIRYEYFDDAHSSDDDMFSEFSKIKKGTVVHHDNFGKGKVMEITGKGESKRARILFDKAGTKNIILKYANLRIG